MNGTIHILQKDSKWDVAWSYCDSFSLCVFPTKHFHRGKAMMSSSSSLCWDSVAARFCADLLIRKFQSVILLIKVGSLAITCGSSLGRLKYLTTCLWTTARITQPSRTLKRGTRIRHTSYWNKTIQYFIGSYSCLQHDFPSQKKQTQMRMGQTKSCLSTVLQSFPLQLVQIFFKNETKPKQKSHKQNHKKQTRKTNTTSHSTYSMTWLYF